MENEYNQPIDYRTLHTLRSSLTVALLAATQLCRRLPLSRHAGQLCNYLVTALADMRRELDAVEAQLIRHNEQTRHPPHFLPDAAHHTPDSSP